jgi:hypothetical protein
MARLHFLTFKPVSGNRRANNRRHSPAIASHRWLTLPRSQLYKLLRTAQWDDTKSDRNAAQRYRALASEAANAAAAHAFDRYLGRAGSDLRIDSPEVAELANPRTAAIAAWVLTHLWDYAGAVDAMTRTADQEAK